MKLLPRLSILLVPAVAAHASPLPLAVAELRKRQSLPHPPPWLGRLNEHGGTLTAGNLHAAIELTLLPFNLQGRRPECAGNTVAEVAPRRLDRCYAVVEESGRWHPCLETLTQQEANTELAS
jgi:hypothetical protein